MLLEIKRLMTYQAAHFHDNLSSHMFKPFLVRRKTEIATSLDRETKGSIGVTAGTYPKYLFSGSTALLQVFDD